MAGVGSLTTGAFSAFLAKSSLAQDFLFLVRRDFVGGLDHLVGQLLHLGFKRACGRPR
jgi:hypothetical protein